MYTCFYFTFAPSLCLALSLISSAYVHLFNLLLRNWWSIKNTYIHPRLDNEHWNIVEWLDVKIENSNQIMKSRKRNWYESGHKLEFSTLSRMNSIESILKMTFHGNGITYPSHSLIQMCTWKRLQIKFTRTNGVKKQQTNIETYNWRWVIHISDFKMENICFSMICLMIKLFEKQKQTVFFSTRTIK